MKATCGITLSSSARRTPAKFGAGVIQNSENVVAISVEQNIKLNKFYSSNRRFTGGMTVREWMNGLDYEQQHQ